MQNFMLLHKQPPMVIPPLPWRSLDSGGYILTRSFLVRIAGNGVHRQALVEAQNSAEGRLSQVYAALNAIGDLAWAINRPMLEVVEQAWKSGEPICELPSQQHAPMLPPPSSRRFMTARAGRQLLAQVRPSSQLLIVQSEHGVARICLSRTAAYISVVCVTNLSRALLACCCSAENKDHAGVRGRQRQQRQCRKRERGVQPMRRAERSIAKRTPCAAI